VEHTLVVKQQTERKSANHQVTTPSVKPNCVETNLPFGLNSALPVRIDSHFSICTSNRALPSDGLSEPPLASGKEPRTHAIQVGDDDEENGLVTATSVTKEPALAVVILMDTDFLKTHEDGDLGAVVLADKGKGVNPREYGGPLYDPNSMIVPAGTTSTPTGGSDSLELVGVHRDKGKNVDPEERGNEMAKCEPGPSRIDSSATKELALAVEILIDNDCLEDRDLGTVVLANKGKGVDPREYGGALYDPNSMIPPAGTTSTGGSDSIELVGIHRDKGKNVDLEERGNKMAKYEPGPSRIDFHNGAMSFQQQVILLQLFKRMRTKDLNDGLHYNPTLPRPSWHPKISPYRFIVFWIPLTIGIVKAVLSLKGSVTIPITLEWISGVVIFLM